MSKGKSRNKLCWCGSGIKFKKCHMNREDQKPIESYEIHNNFKDSLKYKTCKVPNSLKHECSNKIIKAHTISKGANLKHIARDGKVYGININMLQIKEKPKSISLELCHINQASIFYIFCSKHDKELFVPLEDHEFIFSAEQIFLLAYRIVSKAIYLKEQQIELYKNKVIDYDKGLDEIQQHYLQNIAQIFSNDDSQLKDIKNIKNVFDQDLLKKDYSNMKYYCLIIDKNPEVMVAGSFLPDMDFQGNNLINFIENYSEEYNAIFISILRLDHNKGAIVFSWNNQIVSDECEVFIRSLDTLSDENKIKAFTCFLFKRNNENLYISPVWYDALSDEKKELIQSCYIYDQKNQYSDEEIEEFINSDISMLPDFFKQLDSSSQRKLLENFPISDDDISKYGQFKLFNWNIVDIKTNINLVGEDNA